MSFRFNFSCSGSENVLQSQDNLVKNTEVAEKEILEHCGFFPPVKKSCQIIKEEISLLNIGDLEIKYVLIKSIKMKTQNDTFSQIDALKSDIIPGKYEGGLKIWECALDLAIYLSEKNCIKCGDNVLELGCGAGIPGIVAYLNGANVTFQDFNPEVLEYVTFPNTILNTPEDKISEISSICQYLYGDWGSINKKYYSDFTTCTKFDIILTSETIYEKSNFKKLLELMKVALKPDGRIYLAAKIHYFGVGGGITDFETLVKEDQTFDISTVFRIKEGVERQILMIKFMKE